MKEKPKKDSAPKTECPGDWKPTDASLKEKPKEGDDDCDHDWLAAGRQYTEANEEFDCDHDWLEQLLKEASEKNRADLLTKAEAGQRRNGIRKMTGTKICGKFVVPASGSHASSSTTGDSRRQRQPIGMNNVTWQRLRSRHGTT